MLFLITNPMMAQADPGDDPDTTVPINDYIWVLVLVALVFGFMKYRAIQNKRIHN